MSSLTPSPLRGKTVWRCVSPDQPEPSLLSQLAVHELQLKTERERGNQLTSTQRGGNVGGDLVVSSAEPRPAAQEVREGS